MKLAVRLFKRESGLTLVEVLVALAVLGFISVAFLYGLATEGKATFTGQEQATAESLARSGVEYIKNIPYVAAPTTYDVAPHLNVPSGWTIPACVATPVHNSDDGMQAVIVTIKHGTKTVLSLTTYKVNRPNEQ